MKRGFTLLEILVVVSIIGLLSSIIVAGVSPARAQARDSVRVQQVKQIDLAVQLYKANNNGNAPDLGSCAAQAKAMAFSDAISGCVAISTQGVSDSNGDPTPWGKLQSDLKPYMPSLPKDPCGSNCPVAYGNTLGYTYYSPAYFQSGCGSACNGQSLDQLNQNYQLSAQLEQQNTQVGGSNTSSVTAPPVIIVFSTFWTCCTFFNIWWQVSGTFPPPSPPPCVIDQPYSGGYPPDTILSEPDHGNYNTTMGPSSVTLTCYGPGGVVTKSLFSGRDF